MRVGELTAVLVLFIVMSLPTAAGADTARAGKFAISPMLGGFYWDPDTHLGNGPEYGIGAAYNFTESFGAELMFNFADPGTDSGFNNGDINLYLVHLDAVYHFRSIWKLEPYVAAGAGMAWREQYLGGEDPRHFTTLATLNAGGGIEYPISDRVALRGDLRYMATIGDFNYNNFMYIVGITYYIGN